jgi:hypothetical protein
METISGHQKYKKAFEKLKLKAFWGNSGPKMPIKHGANGRCFLADIFFRSSLT